MVPRALRFPMEPATLGEKLMQSFNEGPREEFGGRRVRYKKIDFQLKSPARAGKEGKPKPALFSSLPQ
jgi:hypothetical protein